MHSPIVHLAGIGPVPLDQAAAILAAALPHRGRARTPAQRAFDEAKRLVEQCGFRL